MNRLKHPSANGTGLKARAKQTYDYLIGFGLICMTFLAVVDLPAVFDSAKAAQDRQKQPTSAQSQNQAAPPEISKRLAANSQAISDLVEKARNQGSLRVIIGLNIGYQSEGRLSGEAVLQQRLSIDRVQTAILDQLAGVRLAGVKRYAFIPFLALETDADGLERLRNSPDVGTIEEDAILHTTLAESTALIGAPAAWAAGFAGAGQAVAILDTGVDKSHPFLSGKVVSEACYSTTSGQTTSVCPGAAAQSTSTGSGVNCDVAGCEHGTHVAGIAAGKSATFSGVARDANIIAVKVFSSINGCTSSVDCTGAFNSDILLGMQRVQELSGSINIAAVNLSLGGGASGSNCDAASPSYKTAIDNLRSVGIATVVASGNNGSNGGLSIPACISSAVSVGSIGDGSIASASDAISTFSNSAHFLSLLAPGEWIYSSLPGGGFANFRGTSMAAPHVTGTWAILKSKSPAASVSQALQALTNTGLAITDPRNGVIKPRIRVDAAVNALPTAVCNYTLSSTTQAFGQSGGTGTIGVTAGGGCAWTATSDVPWLAVTSGGNAIGDGTVSYTATANTGFERSGTLLIAGQVFKVTQASAPAIAIDDGTFENASGLAFGGTSYRVNRIAPASYPSTINAVAIYFASDTGVSIGDPLTIISAVNPTGTSVIDGIQFQTLQTTVKILDQFNVYTIPGLAISSGDFVVGMRISHGSGVLPFSIDTSTPSKRRSYRSIDGTTFTLIDDIGTPGNYGIRGLLSQNLFCPIVTDLLPATVAIGDALTIVGGGFTGVSGIKFPNNTAAAQLTVNNDTNITTTIPAGPAGEGQIIISKPGCADAKGRLLTVQSSCTYTIAPTSQSFSTGGGNGSINVTASSTNCAWSAFSNVNWITVNSGGNGTGNGTVNFTVAPNTEDFRTGTLSVAGKIYTITQTACGFSLSPSSSTIGPIGGTASVNVIAGLSSCPWSAKSNYSWITIISGFSGVGNGTVSYSVLPNTSSSARFGSITIGGQFYSVTQNGCAYTLSPAGKSFDLAGGADSFKVSASTGACAWTASTKESWMNVTSGKAGSGEGTVSYSVAANQGLARTGALTVGGQNFSVTQPRSPSATGDLDIAFGAGGKVTVNFAATANSGSYDYGRDVAIQSDGKIVAVGDAGVNNSTLFGIARFNGNGSPDTTFGSGGKVTTQFPPPTGSSNSYASANAVAIQPNGKIVVAGWQISAYGFIALARYNADGSLDQGFGNAGLVSTAVSGYTNGAIYAIALQTDGKIVVGGYAQTSSFSEDILLLRYNEDGSLDTGFGNGGRVVTNVSSYERALALALQPDGKIVAAGFSGNSSSSSFIVLRYNNNGTPDSTFGTSARTLTSFDTGSESARALALQSDGKILLGGTTTNYNVALARYNSNGLLDTTFGNGGKVLSDFGGVDDARDLIVQPDGKFVLAGTTSNDTTYYDFLLARYNADGTLDQTFGIVGEVNTDFDRKEYDSAAALVLQPDGKLVALGEARRSGGYPTFGLARYFGIATCSFSISPTNQTFNSAGGTGVVNVTAGSGCAWTAISNVPWITITSGAGGSGNGSVNFSIAANDSINSRTGTMTVAGQTFSVTQTGSNPVPAINSLSPSSQSAGGGGFTLTVNGGNFINGSVVRWNGNNRATNLMSGTQLTADIPAADIATAGTASVTVFNPTPGGGVSSALSFTINNPQPSLLSLNPNSRTAGGPGFTLTVTGANFVNGSVVRWNGNNRVTNLVSGTQLIADIPAADIATAGTASITVFNSGPGGGVSGSLSLAILQPNPVPKTTSLTPNPVVAGGQSFTLTVNGADYISSSVVRWNGSARTTKFVSSTRLTAEIPAADIANAGAARITVFTPDPGGGISNESVLTIANAVASVSAASYSGGVLATDSIIAAFGTNLATTEKAATTTPLPTELEGTTVKITDSVGAERLAQLFFVAPKQINYLMPAETTPGTATITVKSGDGTISVGTAQIATITPGLFTANASGQGVAAGVALRVKANGDQVYEPIASFDQTQNRYVPLPIDLGPEGEQVFLILYGTGIRYRGALSSVAVSIGGLNHQVQFAGIAPGFVGLDQVNVGPLMRSLAGRGEVDVVMKVGDGVSNVVRVSFK